MTDAIDLSGWINAAEVARLLGMSERTLSRLIASGKGPERRERIVPGRRPEPVFNPRDVNELYAAKNPPRIMPVGITTPPVNGGHGEMDVVTGNAGVQFRQLAASLMSLIVPRSNSGGKYLALKEASELSGLSVTCLRRQIKLGALSSILDGCRKVRKGDLDNLVVVSDSGADSKKGGLR